MKAPKALAWSPFDIRREFGSSLRPGMDTVGHISSLKLVVTAFQLTVMPQLKSVPPAWPEGPTVGVLLSLRGSLSDPGEGYPSSKCVLTVRQSCHFLPLAHDWGLKRALPSK